MRVVCERLVHRYVGREHGGHRGVGWSVELPRELEQTIQRRSDLAGEDLGRPVPPYLAGYPLPDGRFALGRTQYLVDADCLGAVRTETLLLDPAAQAALPDPFDLAGAFDPAPELRAELRRFQEARAVEPIAPLAVELPDPPAPARLLQPLRALDPALLRAVVEGACGPRPLCLVGEPPGGPSAQELLRALLQLHPRGAQWQVAFCALALSPRPWAALQLVPPEAADRFVLRAAREGDVAVVDLARGEARNVEPSAAADVIVDLVARQAWGELDDLARRAGAVAAYRGPADLWALLRYEVLARAPRRTPEEQVELANHLRARGAPEREVAEPFRQLLLDPPEGRLVWLVNVVQAGWLPYRRAHPDDPGDVPEAVEALLLRALAARRFDLALGFLERCWPLYEQARRTVEDAALTLAASDEPIEPAAAPALVELVLVAAERQPARAVLALAHRGCASAAALERAEQALERRAVEAPERRRAGLALLDAAAAVDAWALVEREAARAVTAPWSSPEHLVQVGLRTSALPPSPLRDRLLSDLLARAPAPSARALEAVARALRADGAALALAASTLRARDDLGARPLLRVAVLARRAGLVAEAAAARDLLLRRRARAAGARWPIERARRAVRAGAWARAALALELARDPASPDEEPKTGRLLDFDESLETGIGLPADDVNPDALGGDETGVNLVVPEDTREAWRALARELALRAPEAPGGLIACLPDAAFDDLPWDDLAALASGGDARLTARLAEAAAGPVDAALGGAELPDAAAPHAARALAAALARAHRAGPLGRWFELARGLAAASPAEADALGPAAVERLRAADAPPDELLAAADQALALARALPRHAHDLARAALDVASGRAWPPLAAAVALLDPTRAAGDDALLAELARRVREGALEVGALAPLGPAVLDGALARLGDGFSLRLQNGLRGLVFDLAATASPGRDALIAVALERLRPHVAPDPAFRADVAQGLRSRLGAAAREDALARAIASFEA